MRKISRGSARELRNRLLFLSKVEIHGSVLIVGHPHAAMAMKSPLNLVGSSPEGEDQSVAILPTRVVLAAPRPDCPCRCCAALVRLQHRTIGLHAQLTAIHLDRRGIGHVRPTLRGSQACFQFISRSAWIFAWTRARLCWSPALVDHTFGRRSACRAPTHSRCARSRRHAARRSTSEMRSWFSCPVIRRQPLPSPPIRFSRGHPHAVVEGGVRRHAADGA